MGNYICFDDGRDHSCHPLSCPACGMPQWWVSEPDINLWVQDRPVEYTTSLGEKVQFAVSYKQRDTRPWTINGQKPFLPVNGWNNSWYSYVHFTGDLVTNLDGGFNSFDFSDWTATVYEPLGGETTFTADQGPDPASGDQLLPMDGEDTHVYPASSFVPGGGPNVPGGYGFRLVHADGSQDIYGLVSPLYPTNYVQVMPVTEDVGLPALPMSWTVFGVEYAGGDYGQITPQEVATGDASAGTTNDVAISILPINPGWPTQVVNSVSQMLPVTIIAPPTADAVLTEHIDPYGNPTHFNYTVSGGGCQLQSVTDYDGNISTLGYDTNGYVTNVCMPYGRTASFQYAANPNAAQLLSVTDAQGMTSTFGYVPVYGFLSGMTTPYGATVFNHFETNGLSAAKYNDGVTRAIQIYNPDGSGEMYAFFTSNSNAAPFSYPANVLPTPIGGSYGGLDNGQAGVPASAMYLRNSYYWGRPQFARLTQQSPALLNQLTPNDFRLGRMSHWKLDGDQTTLSGAISVRQDPSPDGVTPGQMTWYDGNLLVSDDNVSPHNLLRLMPDGTTWSETISYDDLANLSAVNESCTAGDGSLSSRTLVSYGYTSVDYSQILYGATNTWEAEWLTGLTAPGVNDWPNVYSPEPISITTGSVVATYPHWYQMELVDASGAATTYFFNGREQVTGAQLPTGLTVTNLYGANGFLAQSIAEQIQATNTYTFANGLPATRLNPDGLLTGYTWDNLERLTGVTYPDGTSRQYAYTLLDVTGQKDRLGNWQTATYDNMRHRTSVTDRNGHTTTLGYCLCGGIASVTDPLGDVTTYNRNLVGWVDSEGFSGVGGGSTTRTFTRDLLGRATGVSDTCGLGLGYIYNMQGLATNILSAGNIVYMAGYDNADRPTMQIGGDGVGVTNSFDPEERLTGQVYGAGVAQWYGYVGWLYTGPKDGVGNQLNLGYDPAGRLAATTDDSGYYTNGFSYTPGGRLATLADGNGHVTTWTHDVYGRMTAKRDGNGVLIETNGYNANGWLTAHWTPAGKLTRSTYDNNGNRLTTVFSSSPTITATYDALNRLTSLTDAVGASTYTYQNFGAFLSAPATQSGPFGSDTVSYTYANRVPQSLTLTEPTGGWTENFGWDGELRLHTVGSPAGTFTYNYVAAGREIGSVTLPGGSSINMSYDGAGQLLSTALKSWTATLDAYTYVYDGAGRRTQVTRVDGTSAGYTYDDLGQVATAVGYEPNGTTLRANENFTYSYDPAANLLGRQNNTLIQSFQSDNANQLVNVALDNNLVTAAGSLPNAVTSLSVNGQAAALYHDLTFAVAGGVSVNILQNNGLNEFTTVVTSAGVTQTSVNPELVPGSVNLRYDANGNLAYDGLLAYTYDNANELASVTLSNAWKTGYAYDGLGRRRIRRDYAWSGGAWAETNEVHYVYDGLTVIQERNANNVPLVTYTRGLDLSGTASGAGGIGGLLARTDANGNSYYHTDGNGNVTALVNGSGTVVARYLYDSFGNPLGMWGSLAAANTQRFSSKEVDPHSGLYYYGYRWYAPNLQRWLSRDPIAERGGINLYGFVGNDAVNGVDPFGLLNYYYSAGGFLEPSGYVPYMEGDTWYGELGAQIYNIIPFIDNAIWGNPGADEANAYNNGDYIGMIGALGSDAMNLVPGEGAAERLTVKCLKFPKLGFRGTKPYRDALKSIQKGGTHVDVGFIPTLSQARQLLEDAGVDMSKIRVEDPHLPPNPHTYLHINYPTPGGGKGTIPIQ